MTDNNNLSASAKFGTDIQTQAQNDQRRKNSAESGVLNRSTVIVVTQIDAAGAYSFLNVEDQLREFPINGKTIDRLPRLIERASGKTPDTNSAYHIFSPENGVPTGIAERVKFDDNAHALIVTYTVNKAVSEMHGLLSLALFSSAGDDLLDLSAEYGIHAIFIVDAAAAGPVVSALTEQLSQMQSVNISSIDDSTDRPVISYDKLPGNPTIVVSGAVRTFIKQNGGEVFAVIPNNGELNVKQQNNQAAGAVDLEEDFEASDEVVDDSQAEEEEPHGEELFGLRAETLTLEQMSEALEAIGYPVSEMAEEGIRETFDTEQNAYLEGESATLEGESDDSDGEEGEEEEQTAGEIIAALIDSDSLDRDAVRLLAKSQELIVYKSDTVETITARIVAWADENIESSEELEELLNIFVGLLGDKDIACAEMGSYVASLSGEESSEEEEDADADEEEEDEEDEEEEDEEEAALDPSSITDPLDFFQFAGGDLSHEQRVAAVVAMGENVEGLNLIQVMKAFNRIKDQQIEEPSDAQIQLLTELSDLNRVQLLCLAGLLELDDTVNNEMTVDQIVDVILQINAADALSRVVAQYGIGDDEAQALVGDEATYFEALLTLLPDLVAEINGEDEEVEDESENEPAGNDKKFLRSVSNESSAGPMIGVEFNQILIVNFSLTDGNTFAPIQRELADINGLNYRVPTNLGSKSKGTCQGALLAPAQALLDMIETTGESRFLADPQTFDVDAWAQSLQLTLDSTMPRALYQDRIPEGADPTEVGLVVGDFGEDDLDEDGMASEEFDAEEFEESENEFFGDNLPIHTLYNARTKVLPVQLDDLFVVMHTTVLNAALPGFWGVDEEKLENMIQSIINRVEAYIAGDTKVKVYCAFTMESAALLSNSRLFQALTLLRGIDNVQSYSASDAARFEKADDVIEVASTLDTRDLPLTVLSSEMASYTFENGGDLTVLIPCFEEELDEEDEGEEEDGDDE